MSKVEDIKINSKYLRGTLEQSLSNNITGSIADDDQIVVKFHGSYQQDDRDRREERAQKKLEKLYSFMLRLRIAGGKVSAKQWLGIHNTNEAYANEVIKITTRQTVQLHGVFKSNLKPTIASFYKYGLDSIAACGDVNRNVMATSAPAKNAGYEEVLEYSQKISEYLLPKTKAYHEIWLDDEKLEYGDKEQEPMYGKTYLPRKFKIVIGIPPYNDVDLYAHDIGLIAIIENGELQGFNITVGGGMGRTHGNENTFARVGDLAGYVPKEKVLEATYHIATIQRDFGNREERTLSRFKYTMAKYGLDWFKEEYAKRFEPLEPAREFEFTKRGDDFGWEQDYKGNHNFTFFIENGRLCGKEKAAIFEIAQNDLANVRFTNNQNIMVVDIADANKAKVEEILQKHKVSNEAAPIRLDSIACVALNTCTLAMAEAQRYLPSLITKIEPILEKHDLKDDAVSIRMTGCPNGCGRPYLAEIGLVGKALGKYNMHIGGDRLGKRLNTLYKEDMEEEAILNEIDSLLGLYVKDQIANENFGDFLFRTKIQGDNK